MKRRLAAIAVIVTSCLGGAALPASGFPYGNQATTDPGGATVPGPLDRVKQAAAEAATTCTPPPGRGALTPNRLTALMLPPSWRETVGASTTSTPHPMILGRADAHLDSQGRELQSGRNRRLYKDSNVDNNGRVFWHPGVGLWQMDDSGDGKPMAIEKWMPYKAVAKKFADRWCSKNFNLDNMWRGWFACNGGTCRSIYNQIYDEATDKLKDITENTLVDYLGGISPRKCRLGQDPTLYDCYYIDADTSRDPDANTSSWTGNPAGATGGKSPTPLARPFYEITVNTGNNTFELRVWLDEDLPDFTNDVTAVRNFAEDSRGPQNDNSTGLLWGDNATLCDTTANRGNC